MPISVEGQDPEGRTYPVSLCETDVRKERLGVCAAETLTTIYGVFKVVDYHI